MYPRCCYYINVTPRGAGLSPRDIHCFRLTTSFTYVIEEGGRVSSNVSGVDCTFTREVLFRKREDLQKRNRAPGSTEDTRRIVGRQHQSSLQCFSSTTLVANWDGAGCDGTFGRVQVDEACVDCDISNHYWTLVIK